MEIFRICIILTFLLSPTFSLYKTQEAYKFFIKNAGSIQSTCQKNDFIIFTNSYGYGSINSSNGLSYFYLGKVKDFTELAGDLILDGIVTTFKYMIRNKE